MAALLLGTASCANDMEPAMGGEVPVSFAIDLGDNIDSRLKLSFSGDGNCTITSNASGVKASGSGKFVSKGDKNSWGGVDRDVLYLDYTLKYDGINCATKDTLVVRDRGVAPDYFNVIAK